MHGRNRPFVDAAGTARLEYAAENDADTVLRAIDREPKKSLSEIARSLGCLRRSKEPHHMRVKRAFSPFPLPTRSPRQLIP